MRGGLCRHVRSRHTRAWRVGAAATTAGGVAAAPAADAAVGGGRQRARRAPALGSERRPRPRRWRPLLTLGWARQEPRAAITYPPSDEDEALTAEERAGDRYPPVGGYPPNGSGRRSCGPRRTPRPRRPEHPRRQQAVVTLATTTTAAMADFLACFLLLSRSYVRSQAAPVVRVALTREALLDLPIYLSFIE